MQKNIIDFEHLTYRGNPFKHAPYQGQKSDKTVQKKIMDFEHLT